MCASTIAECLKNKEFLKSAVYLLIIGGGVAASVFFTVAQYRKVHALRDELAQLQSKSRQYDEFDKAKDRILQQRERISNVLSSVTTDQLLKDKTEQGVFGALEKIRWKTDIKRYRIKPVKTGDGQQVWRIKMKASYREMVAFISLLEQSFKIDKFRIVGSSHGSLHSAELTVYPVTIPVTAATPLPSRQGPLEQYAAVEASLKSIEAVWSTGQSSCTVHRDPLFAGKRHSSQRKRTGLKKSASPASSSRGSR